MAASAGTADPLRSTLDNLQLDPRSEADRPYLVAMLRRLGYTERQIEETVRTGRMPEQAPDPGDGLAPPRDYRVVVPARDTRFELETGVAAAASATDSPFEELERLEFEDPTEELEFESVGEPTWTESAEAAPDEPAPEEGEMQWQDADALPPEDAAWTTTEEGAPGEGEGEALAEQPASFDEGSIDTFGNPDAVTTPERKTRVRVRRVRAGSREEAERKVAGEGRNVIKSVPVDIVERWGASTDKRSGQPQPPSAKGGKAAPAPDNAGQSWESADDEEEGR